MASSSTKSPTVGADSDLVGTLTWSYPTSIYASDNTRASTPRNSTGTTHYLKATAFGFAIPAGATIDGISVEIECWSANAGDVDSEVRLVKADGSIGGTNKATGGSFPSTEAYRSYGGSTDLWGESWDADKINDDDFGVVLSASVASGGRVFVDHIRISVYYTATATGNPHYYYAQL